MRATLRISRQIRPGQLDLLAPRASRPFTNGAGGDLPPPSRPLSEQPMEAPRPSFDAFTRRRLPAGAGKKTVSRQQALPPGTVRYPSIPMGLVNPLVGPSNGMFPDMRGCLVRAGEHQLGLTAFPYPLDEVQLEELRAVVAGFVHGSKRTVGLPRVVTLTYAEAMGDALLEAICLGLAKDLGADCLTFHARDFGGMLDGCAQSWFGRPYFQSALMPRREATPLLVDPELVDPMMEDDLELAPTSAPSSDKWLSQLLKRQSIPKSPAPGPTNVEAKIKETVNLQSVLSFLASCMDKARAGAPVRIVHLSGFGSMMGSQQHRQHILKFAQEASNSDMFTLVIVSENNPKADAVPLGEEGPTTTSPVTMPMGLASYLLTKGRCERLAEIPNTPEYDANWLLDKGAFGGLKLFVVPPKEQARRDELQAMLQSDFHARVRAFNVKRLRDVMDQLGIAHSDGTIPASGLPQLEKAPLLLSEAIYLAYMATKDQQVEGQVVTRESLEEALRQYQETRSLHRSHYTLVPGGPKHPLLDTRTLNKYEKRLLPCIVTSDMVKTRFEDIGAHDKVKRTLHELITLPLERPELFSNGILKEVVSGILLFGPPGTGKTMLAKAVAAQSKSNFIAVNSSNIYDMYVGEGEKNVKALFKLARKLSPCIIFVDEVDAILDARSNAMGKASRVEILNEFMAEWDGLLSKNNEARVMVMAATNRPFALDDAVLRRLPRRVLVDLPDAAARLQILKILLKEDRVDPSLHLESLAGPMTHNYSGSDLKNLCIAAAMNALRRKLTHVESNAPLGLPDFEQALQEVPASVSDEMGTLLDLRKWDQTFGEGKRRAKGSALGF